MSRHQVRGSYRSTRESHRSKESSGWRKEEERRDIKKYNGKKGKLLRYRDSLTSGFSSNRFLEQ